MSQDIIADTLNQIMNAKRAGKDEIIVKKHSKLLLELLKLAKKEKYIEDIKVEDRELKIKFGNLNECKAIKPRFNVNVEEIEDKIKRFLPAKNFGVLVLTTDKGLITHIEAYEKNIGGQLLAYFY